MRRATATEINSGLRAQGNYKFRNEKQSQSPWDFPSYSESVAEEHVRRSTTSIGDKISKQLQYRSLPIQKDSDYDSHSNKQKDYRLEEHDDDVVDNVEEKNSIFSSSEGASFHANSFMELNFSWLLLCACEALGYAEPTPIYVLV